jgi:hypothetical protein
MAGDGQAHPHFPEGSLPGTRYAGFQSLGYSKTLGLKRDDPFAYGVLGEFGYGS